MSRRRRGMASATKSVGYGFVGLWGDGTLGWCLPEHLSEWGTESPHGENKPWARGESTVLCKITVESVKDKRGRPITRRVK